jgi:cysteine desulfurase
MDHNATTPLDKEVQETLMESMSLFGNASSMHRFGREAGHKIEEVRKTVADFINAHPDEIIFTGGGSESNNTVLNLIQCKDVTCEGCVLGGHEIITSSIEHPSVLETVQQLEQNGVKATYLKVDTAGKINMEQLKASLTPNTSLISIMMANNEIGTIQDIKEITRIAHEHGTLVHTDAVQGVGKIPVDVKDLGVDFMSFSGHKIYGPKGVGGLYVRKGSPYCTFIHGGHQEEGRRAGTINTWGIIGLGKAVEVASRNLESEMERLSKLRNRLKEGIKSSIKDITINGHPTDNLPGTLNVSFHGAEGEATLLYLDLAGIAVSTGSACASGSLDPSHVLLATGIDMELAHGSIRFSLGRENNEEDVDYVIEKLPPIIERIRKMSTVYQGV